MRGCPRNATPFRTPHFVAVMRYITVFGRGIGYGRKKYRESQDVNRTLGTGA